MRKFGARTRRWGIACCAAVLALWVGGIDSLHAWQRRTILAERKSRLAPIVTARMSLEAIERIASARGWNYEISPAATGRAKDVVFVESRTLWFPFGHEGFTVFVSLDAGDAAKSMTVDSYATGL